MRAFFVTFRLGLSRLQCHNSFRIKDTVKVRNLITKSDAGSMCREAISFWKLSQCTENVGFRIISISIYLLVRKVGMNMASRRRGSKTSGSPSSRKSKHIRRSGDQDKGDGKD